MITRRSFAGGLALSTLQADPLRLPIGLQLYTVGGEIRKDREAALRRIAEIGYRRVQLATGLAADPRELVRSIRAAGLECTSAHYSLAELLKETAAKIELAQASGLKSVYCSFPWVRDPERFEAKPGDQMAMIRALFAGMTLDDWKWAAERLNGIGGQMKRGGLHFGYHNHNLEFRPFGETTALEELMRLTDPALVSLELDCGWATVGGADAARLIAKYGRRVSALHVKDQKPQDQPSWGVEGFARTTEIGSGIVGWKQVFRAAKRAGVREYYVEQEPPFVKPPLESIAISYRYLHALKV